MLGHIIGNTGISPPRSRRPPLQPKARRQQKLHSKSKRMDHLLCWATSSGIRAKTLHGQDGRHYSRKLAVSKNFIPKAKEWIICYAGPHHREYGQKRSTVKTAATTSESSPSAKTAFQKQKNGSSAMLGHIIGYTGISAPRSRRPPLQLKARRQQELHTKQEKKSSAMLDYIIGNTGKALHGQDGRHYSRKLAVSKNCIPKAKERSICYAGPHHRIYGHKPSKVKTATTTSESSPSPKTAFQKQENGSSAMLVNNNPENREYTMNDNATKPWEQQPQGPAEVKAGESCFRARERSISYVGLRH